MATQSAASARRMARSSGGSICPNSAPLGETALVPCEAATRYFGPTSSPQDSFSGGGRCAGRPPESKTHQRPPETQEEDMRVAKVQPPGMPSSRGPWPPGCE